KNRYGAKRMPSEGVLSEALVSTLREFKVFPKVESFKDEYDVKRAEPTENMLKVAKEKGVDLLIFPIVKRAEVFYIGTTGAYIPNLILWFFLDCCSWFVADEEYGYALEGNFEIVSVHTGKKVFSIPIGVEVKGALDDFQRGWKIWGIIRVPSSLNDGNWDNVRDTLTPHLVEEIKEAVLRGLLVNFAAYTTTSEFAESYKPREVVAVKPPTEKPPEERPPEEKPKPPETATETPTVVEPPKPKKPVLFAVVVGVGEYKDKRLGKSSFAIEDAKEVERVLKELKAYEVKTVLLSDATKETLEKSLSEVEECEMFVFYFAGNGATAPEVETGKQFLLLSDSDIKDLDSTALSLEKFSELVSNVKAKNKLVLLDAGFNSSGAGRTIDIGELKANPPAKFAFAEAKFSTLSACTNSQTALTSPLVKRGFFTHYLLKALSGEADENGDGAVSAEELVNHIKPKVEEQAKTEGIEQTPLLSGDPSVKIMLKEEK
ncbi:MAG: caspase family protein, partial [Planctomycetota bacterium]|nr:caspase family protein [Planctomycetota bacterium]